MEVWPENGSVDLASDSIDLTTDDPLCPFRIRTTGSENHNNNLIPNTIATIVWHLPASGERGEYLHIVL